MQNKITLIKSIYNLFMSLHYIGKNINYNIINSKHIEPIII